jgi:hypothetical protein
MLKLNQMARRTVHLHCPHSQPPPTVISDVSVSGMFLSCSAKAEERVDNTRSVEQNFTSWNHANGPTVDPGVNIPPMTAPAVESAQRGISFEDVKLGSGHEIQERSIITFSSKMKDSAGAPIHRFSYQLASSHRRLFRPRLTAHSWRARSNSARGSFPVRSSKDLRPHPLQPTVFFRLSRRLE